MTKARKMCYDRLLPSDMGRQQRTRSIGGGRMRAIAPKEKTWINGSEMRIRFLGGTSSQHDMVKRIATEWTEHANLNFIFGNDVRAEIRVTFDADDGAWSYVGTDNLNIPLHAATLNLGWQDEGVILHEFGHMIGLAHEHQNPDGGIRWNEQVVLDDLAGAPNFWDEATTRHNVLNKYSADQLHGTEFDADSIMLYAFPGDWTKSGDSTHENDKLSNIDKAFITSEQMYPRADSPEDRAVELGVSRGVDAEISERGEEDLFKFVVADPGTHVIQTMGTTDVYMSLFGPDSPTRLIAEDDDDGAGRNSLITANLGKGTYFAKVRHYSEHRTGKYRILVTR